MPDITTPRDLFLHELGDILYSEKKLTGEVLPKLIDEGQDPDFRKGLERHLELTNGHVTNLEQIFDSMGEQSETEKCLGFEGLKKEHDEMISEVSEDLVDMVDAAAAARTEHSRGSPSRLDLGGSSRLKTRCPHGPSSLGCSGGRPEHVEVFDEVLATRTF